MHWYCIKWNRNYKKPEYVDVIEYLDLKRIVSDVEIGRISTYEELYDDVKSQFISHFMSKCEHEFKVGGLFDKEYMYKIDVYSQISPNLNIIVDLINKHLGLNFERVNLTERSFDIPYSR